MIKKGLHISDFKKGSIITRIEKGVDVAYVYNENTFTNDRVENPAFRDFMGIKCEYIGIYNNHIVIKDLEANKMQRLPYESFENGWQVYEEIPGYEKEISRVAKPQLEYTNEGFVMKLPHPPGAHIKRPELKQEVDDFHDHLQKSADKIFARKRVFDAGVFVILLIFSASLFIGRLSIALFNLGLLVFWVYCGLSNYEVAKKIYEPLFKRAKLFKNVLHFRKEFFKSRENTDK